MAIRSVIKMGNSLLATPSAPLEHFEKQGSNYPGIQGLVQDMLDTMREEGGIGIAAPQIAVNQRVIMYGLEDGIDNPRIGKMPLTVLINPEIKPIGNTMLDDWEGCLSVPGLRGLVSRYAEIEYAGFDMQGNRISGKAEGFLARVIQHEFDHLDGILYPERLKNIKYFGFLDEMS